jgi:hypothetical protein
MSRFKSLKANPRRSLAALATVLVAVGVTGASGASFTAQTANPSNTFAAGTMTMSNSRENLTILTAANMKPGNAATKGEVVIKNTGTLGAAFTLKTANISDSDTPGMSGKLNLVVTDCGLDQDCATTLDNSNKYTGTIAAMGTRALGNFASLEQHRYEFAVALDTSADDSYQGDGSVTDFVWDAA